MNEFDSLMAALTKANVVAYVRNCNVGKVGDIPAVFDYRYEAALLYVESKFASVRKRVEAEAETPTEALKAVIEKAGIKLYD